MANKPKAKARKTSRKKAKPKYVGFYFYDPIAIYNKAARAVKGLGLTLSDYLVECIHNAADGNLQADERRVTEKALAEKAGKSRHVIRAARLAGSFDDLFVENGRRIMYREARALEVARKL